MVDIYDTIRDTDGNNIIGRTKLFIINTEQDGHIKEFEAGVVVSPTTPGTLLIVDDYIIEQIDKVRFVDGTLVVKDGEILIAPEKTPEQLRIEEIKKELALLQGQTLTS